MRADSESPPIHQWGTTNSALTPLGYRPHWNQPSLSQPHSNGIQIEPSHIIIKCNPIQSIQVYTVNLKPISINWNQ